MSGVEELLDSIRRLEAHGSQHAWAGPDPYEGLNATRFVGPLKRHPRGRQIVMQVVKRSPVNLRGPLAIVPTRNAATMAWVVSAYTRSGFLGEDELVAKLRHNIDELVEMRRPQYDDACWSYPFDWQSRVFFYPKTDPNTIATAFAGMALLDAYDRLRDPQLLELAASSGRFFVRNVPQTEDPPGAHFGYLVGDRSPIHNANTHVCALLARLTAHSADEELSRRVREGLAWTIERQRPDGSWPYGERSDLSWVDNFHTGYVLDSLRACADAGFGEAEEPWRRGLAFLRSHMFLPDGTPRYYSHSTYPIDSQSVAQSIQTLSIAAQHDETCLDDAWRVFHFAQRSFRRRDGLYYFQRRRYWINRAPHMRWVVGAMFLAFTHLLEAERMRENARGARAQA